MKEKDYCNVYDGIHEVACKAGDVVTAQEMTATEAEWKANVKLHSQKCVTGRSVAKIAKGAATHCHEMCLRISKNILMYCLQEIAALNIFSKNLCRSKKRRSEQSVTRSTDIFCGNRVLSPQLLSSVGASIYERSVTYKRTVLEELV